nr:hypothetical protein [Candidatus Njordarchaeum guaymaensis]
MSELGDYVSLKEFDGSSGWYARVHSDGLRYMKIFEKLSGDRLKEVARALGGEVVDKKFYDNVAWTVQVRPLPYLQILMVLTLDPEFGNDFFTYYSRSALGESPTEDIIVYSWIFISLLAREAQKALYGQELKFEKEEMAKALLEERLRVFKYIDSSTARKVSEKIGGRSAEIGGATWAIEKEPVPKFNITYLLKGEKGEIIYDMEMVEKFHYFHDFLWLYCNAIIRESRKMLGDKIPRLSASGIL